MSLLLSALVEWIGSLASSLLDVEYCSELPIRCGEVIVVKLTLSIERTFFSLSLALSTIVAGQMVAQAETGSDSSPASISAPQADSAVPSAPVTPEVLTSEASSAATEQPPVAAPNSLTAPLEVAAPAQPGLQQPILEKPASFTGDATPLPASLSLDKPLPKPGTASTSARQLQAQADDPAETTQAVETRYQFSYIGAGVNLGAGGDSGLGKISFAAFSKFALNPYLSFRPSILVSSDVSFLFPVTYDFPITAPGAGIAPYVGAGVMFSTGEDSNVDLLLSGGVDIPLSSQLVATAGVNIGPFDKFDIGFLLGIAYNFSSTTYETPVVRISDLVPPEVAAIRPNLSYIGAGVNLGVAGETALGDTSAAIFSKIALGPSYSVRPAMLITNNVDFLIPVTYDFAPIRTSYITLAPFLGAGLNFSTRGSRNVDLLLTAGVDVPITQQLVFTSSVNIAPINSFDAGFLLGVAYSFGSF